jgi:hypothetical protein
LLEVDGVGTDTAAACISPVIGAAVAAAPYARRRAGAARPGGRVLAQTAWVSLRAAFHGLRTSALPLTQTAAVTTMAAIITALAEHTAGWACKGSTPQRTVTTRR